MNVVYPRSGCCVNAIVPMLDGTKTNWGGHHSRCRSSGCFLLVFQQLWMTAWMLAYTCDPLLPLNPTSSDSTTHQLLLHRTVWTLAPGFGPYAALQHPSQLGILQHCFQDHSNLHQSHWGSNSAIRLSSHSNKCSYILDVLLNIWSNTVSTQTMGQYGKLRTCLMWNTVKKKKPLSQLLLCSQQFVDLLK